MLTGARRPRRPNPLRIASRLIGESIRIARRMAKREPHLFGPKALDYYLETAELEQQRRQLDQALRKIYGSDDGQRTNAGTVWCERYPELAKLRESVK
jgi:hypothetical protein